YSICHTSSSPALILTSSSLSLLFFFPTPPPHPTSPLFPYTTLFRSPGRASPATGPACRSRPPRPFPLAVSLQYAASGASVSAVPDRKSTRLNSSHLGISYAVFCLKKKKKKNNQYNTIKNNPNDEQP